MINIITKTLRSSFLILAFSLLLSFNAIAQTCGTPPTCEELGYNFTEAKCGGVASLKCPFDKSKMYCAAPVMVGDILYSDKSFASNLIPSKTPIGIVFDAENRLAVALDSVVGLDSAISMGEWPGDVPDLSLDDGKLNTKLLLQFKEKNNALGAEGTSMIGYPAVEYAAEYSTPGTKAGDWFLPSAKQAGSNINKEAVKAGLELVGKTPGNTLVMALTSNVAGNACQTYVIDFLMKIPAGMGVAFPVINF